MITEQQIHDALRSAIYSVEDLAVNTLLELLNGELSLEEVRDEMHKM